MVISWCNFIFSVFRNFDKSIGPTRLEQMMLKSTNGSKESTGKTFITGSVAIHLSQFHLIIPQKIETASGAKVEIRGRHVQLWRLPRGRPEQSPRCQWKGAKDLWWLLITSSRTEEDWVWSNVLSVDLPKLRILWAACINVISIWPTSSQQIYFCSYSKCIFTSNANIFLNVLQIYFCKILLCIICAPQLKNLKYEQYKTLNKWYQFSSVFAILNIGNRNLKSPFKF